VLVPCLALSWSEVVTLGGEFVQDLAFWLEVLVALWVLLALLGMRSSLLLAALHCLASVHFQ
jgi:hypothetical protein